MQAHLQIESLRPERERLPVTETGYRSSFIDPAIIDAEGGPVACVRAWLDEAAKDPAWKLLQETKRQRQSF